MVLSLSELNFWTSSFLAFSTPLGDESFLLEKVEDPVVICIFKYFDLLKEVVFGVEAQNMAVFGEIAL